MNIQTSNNFPDSTYFAMSDVEPILEGDNLTVFAGKGTRRSWGAPEVTSTIFINTSELVSIHVGFHHKHRGGQGWHHYRLMNGKWQKRTWAQLSEEQRELILNHYEASLIPSWEVAKLSETEQAEIKAKRAGLPSWAKVPGKLASSRKTPTISKRVGYKLVAFENDKMVSLYDRGVEYAVGKLMKEKAQEDHGGGYYAYPTVEGVKALWANGELVPSECYAGVSRLALLEVEASGTIVEYGKKYAATYLRPTRVIEIIEVSQ